MPRQAGIQEETGTRREHVNINLEKIRYVLRRVASKQRPS
jgi:hypothetical protein